MNQFISDTSVFEGAVYEEVQPSRPGILRTIKGPVAEYGKLNRNKRMYTEKLWDRVLESPYVVEQLKYKTLLGESNHPEDRFEVDFERVSHSITEMWKVPDRDQIYATINILDTPFGRILDTLYKSGSIVGYSSRAGGTLHQRKDHIDVDENTYNFITFDAVPFPSVEAARPSDISEGVKTEYQLSDEAHNALCSIIKEYSSSSREALKDFIYSLEGYDMSREKALLEGSATPSCDSQCISSDPSTLSLLKESTDKIEALKIDNQTLMATKESLIRENENLRLSLNSSLEHVSDLMSQIDASKESVDESSNRLNDAIRKRDERISELESELEDVSSDLDSLKSVHEACRALRYENETIKFNASANEEAVHECGLLKEKVSEITKQLNEAYNEISSLVTESSKKDEEISRLEGRADRVLESVDILEKSEKKLIQENKKLSSELSSLGSGKVSKLEAENARLSNQIGSLNESIDSMKSKMDQYKEDLLSVICSGYNLTVESVRPALKAGFTKSDIYCVCEEMVKSAASAVIVGEAGKVSISSRRGQVRTNDWFPVVNRRGIK